VDIAASGPEFAGFVRAHTTTLLRTAYLLTGDRASAEDLVQDTLLRLWPKWQLVAAADAPLAYVRRSLANNFVNTSRRGSSREVAVEFLPERSDLEVDIGRVDDRSELWAALSQLPARQRAALVLRYYDDLTDASIGEMLGCREATVRSLISRGLTALRRSVAEPPALNGTGIA
jgi:RNA polymerase sigma-70 factor (sigma-E family)